MRWLCSAGLILCTVSSLRAQVRSVDAPSQTGTLAGIVSDAATARPLVGAQVFLNALKRDARTDDRGRFSPTGLPDGKHELEVRQLGYQVGRRTVEVKGGNTTNQDVKLERVAVLDSVAVTASRARYSEFERHKKFATHGTFLDEAAIDRDRDHVNFVSDIIARVPGWRVKGQGSNATTVNECMVVVDNMREPDVPNTRGGMLNGLHPSDIGAIELYPLGSRSMPIQFHAKCLIMIWKKKR